MQPVTPHQQAPIYKHFPHTISGHSFAEWSWLWHNSGAYCMPVGRRPQSPSPLFFLSFFFEGDRHWVRAEMPDFHSVSYLVSPDEVSVLHKNSSGHRHQHAPAPPLPPALKLSSWDSVLHKNIFCPTQPKSHAYSIVTSDLGEGISTLSSLVISGHYFLSRVLYNRDSLLNRSSVEIMIVQKEWRRKKEEKEEGEGEGKGKRWLRTWKVSILAFFWFGNGRNMYL